MFTHSLTSDWNNGNAHFLRGLARALMQMGHSLVCWEAESPWSKTHLLADEHQGLHSVDAFHTTYPELQIAHYTNDPKTIVAALQDVDVAIVHEWHSAEFMATLLTAAEQTRCRLLFHDTHHRASSSPEQIRQLQIERFDGVLAFGEALKEIYVNRFAIRRVWTFHEAADTSVFCPRPTTKTVDVIWIGNWGDGERTHELHEYLIEPAKELPNTSWLVHGVRYPSDGVAALNDAGISFGGYLPNLAAPPVYRTSRITLHIPRQQYQAAMRGIPTIRVFEALAMGIPLISAPWQDSEQLFRQGDYLKVNNGKEMVEGIRMLLNDPEAAKVQAWRGLETILSRHTCRHRAEELSLICEDVLA